MVKKFEFQDFSLLSDLTDEEMARALGKDLLDELAAAMQDPHVGQEGEEENTPPPTENVYTEVERLTYGEERYQQGYLDAKMHFEAIGHEEHERTMQGIAMHMALLREELLQRRQHIAPHLAELIGSIIASVCQQLPEEVKLEQLRHLLEQGLAANDEDTSFTLLVKTEKDATIYEHLIASLALPFACNVQTDETMAQGELRLQWQDGYAATDQTQWCEAMKALLLQVKLP